MMSRGSSPAGPFANAGTPVLGAGAARRFRSRGDRKCNDKSRPRPRLPRLSHRHPVARRRLRCGGYWPDRDCSVPRRHWPKKVASDPEVRQGLVELAALLERQDELTRQANGELRYLGEQVSSLKNRQLAASGISGGTASAIRPVGVRRQVATSIGAASGSRLRLCVASRQRLPAHADRGVQFKSLIGKPSVAWHET